MNKLRTFVAGAVGLLVVFTAWVAIGYGIAPGSVPGYAGALAAMVVLPGVPFVATHGKRWFRILVEYRRNREGLSFERKSIFVSDDAIDDRGRALDAIETAIDAGESFDGCSPDRFTEGPGLTVRHTGFHNSFVRVGTDGRLVVTGASKKTHELASLVERVTATAMSRTRRHPFLRSSPVRGAPRSFMGAFLVGVLLFGLASAGAAAYPAEMYSAPERLVLVGYDTRAAAAPGYTATDATLDKSAFLVDALDEEAVELQWDRDDASRLEQHTHQSVRLSSTLTAWLSTVRERELSASQRDRVDRLERELHAAECRVASTVTTRIEAGRVDGDPSAIERDRATLRQRAASAGAACAG